MCRARGTFVYNRALDRNGGATLTDALLAVRQWDAAHAVPQDIRDLHYILLRVIYSTPWSTPEITRQAIELDCLEHAQATPAAQAAPRTPAAPAPQRHPLLGRGSIAMARTMLPDARYQARLAGR